jgi:hypothetical protein
MMTATQALDKYNGNMNFHVNRVLEDISKAVDNITNIQKNANLILSRSNYYQEDIIDKEDHRGLLLYKLKQLGYLKVEYFPPKFWGSKQGYLLPQKSSEEWNWYSNKCSTCCSSYIHLDWSK